MKILSIIIPTYNCKYYLKECLNSIYNRYVNEDKYEIIVVDDGSTDNTMEMLKEIQQDHHNMVVYQQPNQGQSVARNLGIEKACGRYIYFVDADDAIDEKAYVPEKEMLEDKYDIIGIEVKRVDTNGDEKPYSHQKHQYNVVYNKSSEYLRTHNVLGIVYGYYFKRQLLVETGLRFTPKIYHQDEEFVMKAFCYGGPMVYLNIYTYKYYKRMGSSIHTYTRQHQERLMDDAITVMTNICSMQEYKEELKYKLSYYSTDIIRLLIRQKHDVNYTMLVIEKMRRLGFYPLPWMMEIKYLIFKIITSHPMLIRFWLRYSSDIF